MSQSATLTEAIADTSFVIHLRFLTNRCAATRVNAREKPEWPPHPGRLYMALAAAYFETDGSENDKEAERAALQWLEALPAPRIRFLESNERTPVTFYVPVNDRPQPNKAMLQSAPGMSRSRQSRSFPTVIPSRIDTQQESDPDVSFEWTQAIGLNEHLSVLDRLCSNVIRVGHSSSLVMAWAQRTRLREDALLWEPSQSSADMTCRVTTVGELDRLKTACRADEIERFGQLLTEIASSKGKAKSAAKQRFEIEFGQSYKASLRAPEPTPASLGMWQGYQRITPETFPNKIHVNDYFERDLIILAQYEGPILNVERTLGLTQALRQTTLRCIDSSQIPAWLSGHDEDRRPTEEPHTAFLALPFVGYPHADGHLMGLAIALPCATPAEERGRWLAPLLIDPETGEVISREIELWGRNLPDWKVKFDSQPSPPRTLRNSTWTKAATTWASVTPIVLDRFPKSSHTKDRKAWQQEVQEMISLSCTRSGLPEPIEVDIDSTSWHAGVPRAWAKKRRLYPPQKDHQQVAWGDGFPFMPTKTSRPPKPQVHAWLRFDRRVTGPVLIGAGRFLGYGLCKPIEYKEAKS
jgi:CRISPR-associated protein Csb2